MRLQFPRVMVLPLLFLVVLSNVASMQLVPVIASRDDARASIGSAEQALLDAYQGVLAAESAGADVTTLVETLNEALDLLSQARESLDIGDYSSSLGYASQSKQLSDQVISEAAQLKVQAEGMSQFWAIASIVGVPLVLVVLGAACYYGYKILRKRSVEGIMKKRIKVLKKEKRE